MRFSSFCCLCAGGTSVCQFVWVPPFAGVKDGVKTRSSSPQRMLGSMDAGHDRLRLRVCRTHGSPAFAGLTMFACVFTLALALSLLMPISSQALEFDGQFAQGGLVVGKAGPGAKVTLNDIEVPVGADGTFLLGFGRDEKTATLTVEQASMPPIRRPITLETRSFDIQRIDGLPQRKVTPLKLDLPRIKREKALMTDGRAVALRNPSPLFASGFIWPAEGRISGVYGSQRVLNGVPKRPHFGVDIAGPIGTEVVAMADGIVQVAHDVDGGMFFNGKTVLLDHGLGLTSVYIHLDTLSVETGQRLKQGEHLGTIGNTGRSTGPHLHWGVTWNGVPVDPALLPGLPPR